MPRYFFHIDGKCPYTDDVGELLSDDNCAWEIAVRTVRDIDRGFLPGDEWRLKVCREDTSIYDITIVSRRVAITAS